MSAQTFVEQVEGLNSEVAQLVDEFSAEQVEQTAKQLEGLSYTPPVITPVAKFIRLRKNTLIEELERIREMSEAEACALAPGDEKKCDDLRIQHMTVIIFYYKKLLELRGGNPEEWDEVDELYVHD